MIAKPDPWVFPDVGELVACRLTGSPTVILGVVEAVDAELKGGITLRFPAELRPYTFMTTSAITRSPQPMTTAVLFFLALAVESFGWSELASCHVLRDDDVDTKFNYARNVLTDYRQNVARWSPEAVRVPTRLIETG